MTKKMYGTLTCPECTHKQKMQIPEQSCIHSYTCTNCKKEINAKESCCVFCDYSDTKCPIASEHKQ